MPRILKRRAKLRRVTGRWATSLHRLRFGAQLQPTITEISPQPP
jgi:hypothetical protein